MLNKLIIFLVFTVVFNIFAREEFTKIVFRKEFKVKRFYTKPDIFPFNDKPVIINKKQNADIDVKLLQYTSKNKSNSYYYWSDLKNNENTNKIETKLLYNDRKTYEVSLNETGDKMAIIMKINKYPKLLYLDNTTKDLTEFSSIRNVIDQNPIITADGSKIYYVSDKFGNKEIFVVNIAKNTIDIVVDNLVDNIQPTINKNGTILAYSSPKEGGYSQIYVKNLNTGKEIIPSNPDYANYQPKLSDSGNYLVYVSSDDQGQTEIMYSDISNKYNINLSDNPSKDINPDISGDGKKVVFQSDRTGDNEIYLVDFNTKKFINISHDFKSQDINPSISKDGKILVYQSISKWMKSYITIIYLDTKKKYIIYDKKHFRSNPYISRDGKRIVYSINKIFYTADLSKINNSNKTTGSDIRK